MKQMCSIYVTNTKKHIQCFAGNNLQEVLQAEGYLLPAFCGGKGKCGKCLVYVEGTGNVSACQMRVQGNLTVTLLNAENGTSHFEIVGHESDWKQQKTSKTKAYKVAIDIGTTTLAFSLLEAETGICAGSYSLLNSQRIYGADVLSRIQAVEEGRGRELQDCIQRDLAEGMHHLLEEGELKPDQVEQIVVVGNTVMLHILRGYSCKGFSHYPFETENLAMEKVCIREAFGDIPVVLLPGIAAFIGADITAGVYQCAMHKDQNSLLIDMGTNGEMILRSKGKYYAASVAAGPAFEGGNILWGAGSVDGAIAGAKMQPDGMHITTIRNKPPIGICGTGLVEVIAELLKNEIIDETGKLTDAYFEKGYPVAKTKDSRDIILTQKDIRQFQMAKSALCAGMEVLLKKAGITCEKVDTVYLAGGFGRYLDVEKAARTGLIPWKLRRKAKAVGNSALLGAEKYAGDVQGTETLEEIVQNTIEVMLSMEEAFQDRYIENCNFCKETGSIFL